MATNVRQAIIWGRFSSFQQADGDSRDRQERNNRTCAQRHGIQVLAEYFDEGVSVKAGVTPHFRKVLADLPNGVGIICEDLDRINRAHSWRAKAYLLDIIEAGHWVLTSSDNIEYNEATINQLSTLVVGDIKSSIAFEENDKRTKRVKEEKRKAIQMARDGLPAPLGAWLPSFIKYDFTTRQYRVLNDIKAVTQKIFTLYVEGKGTSSIAQQLNKELIPTFGSKKVGGWARSSIGDCLRYVGNIGTLKIKGEYIKNAFPAAISEDLFYQVQSRLKNNISRHGNYASNNVPNILRGVCKCAVCHSAIKVKVRKIKSLLARYYQCSGHNDGRCVVKNNIRCEAIEYEFMQWLVPAARDALLGANPTVAALETLAARQTAVNSRIGETMALWDKGMKLPQVEKRLFDLQAELKGINNQITEATASISNISALPDDFNKLDAIINGTLDNQAIRKQVAAIVPSIIKEVLIDLRDRDIPSFDVELVNGKRMKWWLDIEEYWHDAKGKGKVINGKFRQMA